MILNLARALRPQTFDQLIGQSINVRMIKNSLYRNYFFPVYLLTGQKGTGKTSLARILATALNCSALSVFQKEPKLHSLPCLECASCKAMSLEHHPDFIEMDGASQTGIDAIRTIIEAASFMPILGSKKVYLIDEAHMLSKAAFNALLKMLEEPPPQVHFILATTEHTKVIETVRSRSFQLFFNPVKQSILTSYLEDLCAKENITIDKNALSIIAQESQGSVRDAINILEQARFAASSVSEHIVYQILGYPSQETIEKLLEFLLDSSAEKSVAYIKNSLSADYSSVTLWTLIAKFFSTMLTSLHKIDQHKFLTAYLSYASLDAFIRSMHVIYAYEQKIVKSVYGYGVLQCMFLELHALANTQSYLSTSDTPLKKKPNLAPRVVDDPIITDQGLSISLAADDYTTLWNTFLRKIEVLKDPLLLSIFKQVVTQDFTDSAKTLSIYFYKDMYFFEEIIDTTRNIWTPLFIESFGESTTLKVTFNKERPEALQKVNKPEQIYIAPLNKQFSSSLKKEYRLTTKKNVYSPPKIPLDISDVILWPKAHALQALFGGAIYLE